MGNKKVDFEDGDTGSDQGTDDFAPSKTEEPITAGVESGCSTVEPIGGIDEAQTVDGTYQTPDSTTGTAKRGGKSFEWM